MMTPQGISYSVPVPGTQEEGYSPIYRAYGFEEGLIENYTEPVANLWEVFERAMSKVPKNPFLGTRVKYQDGTFGPYVWKTYEQIKDITMQIASGIEHYGMAVEEEFAECELQQKFKFIGIFSKNREEWNVTDYACCAMGYTLVPLYDTLGHDAIKLVLNKTRMSTIIASGECVEKLLKLDFNFDFIKFIVSMDYSEEAEIKTQAKGITYITWDALQEAGMSNPYDYAQHEKPTMDSVNTISFTSGTTGEPKGAIITHRNFVSALAALDVGLLSPTGANLSESDVCLSYLPMAHIYERIVEIAFAGKGSKIGFFCGDILKITNDLDELCPTVFVSVPRLYFRMNEKIMANVKSKSMYLQKAFNFALNSKIQKLDTHGKHTHWLYDLIFFGKSNKILGGECRIMISGGAPLSKQMQEKMSSLFCVPFSQGYGLTESMGGSFLAHHKDTHFGHVGGPNASLQFKLRSVPEKNYFVTSDPPMGELMLKGHSISPGYFLNEEATKEMYEEDGWFHTGDIVKVSSNGSISIIDRSKNIFKLSQGEYIIPEKIEDQISQLPMIEQVFVTGHSVEQFAVAVVYPNEEACKKWYKKAENSNKKLSEIYADPDFNHALVSEITQACKKGGLNGFEIPKKIYITSEAFSIENDLLTPSFKIRRANCEKTFKVQIDELYNKKD